MYLKKKFGRNADYRRLYIEQINKNIDKGYAEIVDTEAEPWFTWYLPHHGVINPHKPGKVRVVMNASSRYRGNSLNETVYQVPDLNNKLIQVITRFRERKVTVSADIEGMFNQSTSLLISETVSGFCGGVIATRTARWLSIV